MARGTDRPRRGSRDGRELLGGPIAARRAARAARVRRRRTALASVALLAIVALLAALLSSPSGGGGGRPSSSSSSSSRASVASIRRTRSHRHAARRPRPAGPPRVTVTPAAAPPAGWRVVARVNGQPAAWIGQHAGVTLMRFDQRLVHLNLHAGSLDGGVQGWRYGDQIEPSEIHLVIAAFNGGFKLTYSNVGFMSGGHVAVPIKRGLGSIVTYADGTSSIAAWGYGVPDPHKRVFSVLQNQQLLVDRGRAAATVNSCIITCWGATIQGLTVVARSGIGVTRSGMLVWGAGEQLTPATLASGLIAGGAVRAIELDINPDWVDGYLYVHHATGPTATPVVPGQLGIAGQFLAPYSRAFLTIVANG